MDAFIVNLRLAVALAWSRQRLHRSHSICAVGPTASRRTIHVQLGSIASLRASPGAGQMKPRKLPDFCDAHIGECVPEPAVSAPVRAPRVGRSPWALRRADAPTKALPSLRSSRAEVISLRRHATISCTGSALTFVRLRCQPFRWNNQPAPDALRREREASRAAEFIGDEFGNYAPAYSQTCPSELPRRGHRFPAIQWSAHQASARRRTAPADRNPPLLFG